MKKIIIVGSGFSGSVLARKIAEELDREVLIVEKRPHIAGNMYDEYDEHGILVQRYGPHFIFTDHFSVVEFLGQFGELFPYDAKLLSFIDGHYVRLPFNFETVKQLAGAKKATVLLPKLRESFRGRDRVPVSELVNHADPDVSSYGKLLFEKAYRTYTCKMWGLQPEEIDPSVLERVPMAMNYEERYQSADFQYLPVDGFTGLFKKMLDHPNISVQLNTDALDHLKIDGQNVLFDGEVVDCLIYTGPIDELFGYKFGVLPYRSLDIKYEYHEENSVFPCEIISYPQAKGYTRSTEYRKIMFDDSNVKGSVIATEYPLPYKKDAKVGNIPYYPVLTDENTRVYRLYRQEADKIKNLFLCGRLADFKYYNMDICILHALEQFQTIKNYLLNK